MRLVSWDKLRTVLKPQRRITRITLLGGVLYVTGVLVERSIPDSIFGILTTIGLVLLFIGCVYFFFRFLAWLQRKLLWKVRNKILVSYAFIGIMPLVLISIMTWLLAKMVFGQLGAFYVRSAIESVLTELDDLNTDLHLRRTENPAGPRRELTHEDAMQLVPEQARRDYPDLQLRVYRERNGSYHDPASGQSLPSWIKPPLWKGVTIEQGTLQLQSIRFGRAGKENHATEFSLPLASGALETLRQRTGVEIAQFSPAAGSTTQDTSAPNVQRSLQITLGQKSNDAADPDFKPNRRSTWVMFLQAQERASGDDVTALFSLLAPLPIHDIYNYYFQNTGAAGQVTVALLVVAGGALLFVEIVSVFIGLMIARSITRSVHQMSLGANSILSGNFDYRISARNHDQFDQLAHTFNQMSSRIQLLLKESAEKQRLEKEIEIAREVQSQLFPRYIPKSSTLDLSGTCLPAQMVSGDYYDFLTHSDSIDMIIGDISGKGISAALLMANLQSTIRTYATLPVARADTGGGSTAQIVHLINRQLYDNTLPEKYATLFYGRFLVDESALLYCNAGHNPPLLFHKGSLQRLAEGGTVVGLFDGSIYSESRLALEKGDVLILYTDGLTEAEDPEGQDFGEQRLIDLVAANLSLPATRLQYLITEEIQKWVSGGPQSDDITLVVARIN